MRNEMQSGESRKPQNMGNVVKEVEHYASRVPSSTFISLAAGSVLLSAALALFGRQKALANFVGLWAPTLVLAGLYKKISQLESENHSQKMH